jgi:Zn-dependent protease/CBS domain-containing protein
MLVRPSWRLGSLAGIEIAIHPSWFVIFALFAYVIMKAPPLISEQLGLPLSTKDPIALGLIGSFAVFASVVIHEFCHALVARRLGIPIGNITLFLFGGVATILREPGSPADELKVAAAGPAASLGLGVLFGLVALIAAQAHWQWILTLALILAVVNVMLAIFNLLPAFPSDGGRILRAVLWKLMGSQARATGAASVLSAGIAAVLIVLGGYLTVVRRLDQDPQWWTSLWLMLIAIFLLQAAMTSGRQARINRALERMRVGDCMARTLIPVADDATLAAFLAEVPSDGKRVGYPVVQDGAFVGLVNPRDTGSVTPQLWSHTPVSAIMTPAAKMEALAPDDFASDALAALTSSGVRSLPVFEGGQLTGVVSHETIFGALRDQQAIAR